MQDGDILYWQTAVYIQKALNLCYIIYLKLTYTVDGGAGCGLLRKLNISSFSLYQARWGMTHVYWRRRAQALPEAGLPVQKEATHALAVTIS